MLAELKRIRELLEGEQPLGFGKRPEPVFVFVRHSPESLWYSRDKREAQNVPLVERDLTGYVRGIWRYDRVDGDTGENVPKLMTQVHADREYVIQSGLETNFSKSLLAGLLELPPEALSDPLTLVVEDNSGGRGRPTVFARVEWHGSRAKPAFDRTAVADDLLVKVQARFGLSSPFGDEKS